MWQQARLLTCLLCAAAVIVWLAVEAVQAQSQPEEEESEVGNPAELRVEVQQLKERVRQLEERLSQLEGGIQPLEYRFVPDARAIPEGTPLPGIPGHRPHGEINGIPYYIIPVDKDRRQD